MTRTSDSSRVAVEIDRLVVGGYTAAVTSAAQPASLNGLTPYAGALLHTVAFVLLAGPLTYEDLTRIVPFTPAAIVEQIIDISLAEGVLESGSPRMLELTAGCRGHAEGVVELHERTVEHLWAPHQDDVEALVPLAANVVRCGLALPAPIVPAAFPLFAELPLRPTPATRLLRFITAIRYWRADAHRRALIDAQLSAPQAHDLNRLWDQHRGIERVGQNYPDPTAEAGASLAERGLVASGKITRAGIALREEVEASTDRGCDPLFEGLSTSGRQQRFFEG